MTRRLASVTDGSGRRVDIDTQFTGGLRSVTYDQSFDSGGHLLSALRQTPVYDGLTYPTVSIPYSHGWLTQQGTTWSTRPNANASFAVSTMHQNGYGYDPTGQRLSNTVTDNLGNARTESYGYDSLNRLTGVDYGDGQTQGYGFDAMGNRLTKSDSSTGNETYGYDAANRLTSRTIGTASHTVSSDANGNTLSDGTRTNTWDSQNRLVLCASNAGGSATTSAFTYGRDGMRRKSVVTNADGTSTRMLYVYDGTILVEEIIQHFTASGTAADSAIEVSYMQGPSGPLYRKSSAVADPSWYVYDGLGSVVGEVDVNGNVTASKLFDVYGLTRSVSGSPTTRQGFVGQLGHESDDETGLIYMQHRYCDAGTGRFISQDPGQNGSNWFDYADDNPTNKVDKNGCLLKEEWEIWLAMWQDFEVGFAEPWPGPWFSAGSLASLIQANGGNVSTLMGLDLKFEGIAINFMEKGSPESEYAQYLESLVAAITAARAYIGAYVGGSVAEEEAAAATNILIDIL